jgi:hypothetical protein
LLRSAVLFYWFCWWMLDKCRYNVENWPRAIK